ncbi:VP4 [Gokushovirus WZ-2015a]|nr:VP4 [Gokushovirus WZ-2015a]
MSCNKPMRAYISLEKDEEGKKEVIWNNNGMERITKGVTEEAQESLWRKGNKLYKLQMIPCNKCLGCKMDYAKEKAKRLELESKYTIGNWFITLTYDEEHIPKNGRIPTLKKEELIKYIKNIRRYNEYNYNCKIRFLASGEYGGQTKRPHYHIILLNAQIEDLAPLMVKNDTVYYTSKIMSQKWNKGQIMIARANTSTNYYTAGYCEKKAVKQEDFTLKEPEFIIQSRNLGKQYYEDNKEKLFTEEKAIIGGVPMNYPKYFSKLAKENEELIEELEEYKQQQKEIARLQADYQNKEQRINQEFWRREHEEEKLLRKYKERNKI